jgi:N-acetylmuramoyl-L-alanine amidase
MRAFPFHIIPVFAVGALLLTPVLAPQAEPIRSGRNAAMAQNPSPANLTAQASEQATEPFPSVPQAGAQEDLSRTVVLDPGHGGADFGARGPTGLAESDVVLDFARAARIALEAQRMRVLLTREGNQDPSFDNRSTLINGLRNAIFISLHVSSSGPVGTARSYYYLFPSDAPPPIALTPTSAPSPVNSQTQSPPQISSDSPSPPPSPPRTQAPLVEWDHAQQKSVNSSRELADLMQTELTRRFKGSPETPIAAPVRQLRTIAAPAIAIEISSIDVTDAKRLAQMAQPLAEAIARAVSGFHYPSPPAAAATPGGH